MSFTSSANPSKYTPATTTPSISSQNSTQYTPSISTLTSSTTAPTQSTHLPLLSQTSNPNTSNSFKFPRDYAFPPFYSIQVCASTLHAQLRKWSTLILSYCQFHRITKLSISSALDTELFYNKKINRRLARKDLEEVLRFMRKEGTVEIVGGTGKKGKEEDGNVVWVWWRSVEEWGTLIEEWVAETGQKGSVLTLYELTESDATVGQDFHGLDPELLQKALAVLVKRGKAQIFGQEDSQGIKFF